MARESYTSSTLGVTDPPHRGGDRLPLSPLHHEAKQQVQFWSTPRSAFTPEHQRTTWTTRKHTDTQPIARKPTYLVANQK